MYSRKRNPGFFINILNKRTTASHRIIQYSFPRLGSYKDLLLRIYKILENLSSIILMFKNMFAMKTKLSSSRFIIFCNFTDVLQTAWGKFHLFFGKEKYQKPMSDDSIIEYLLLHCIQENEKIPVSHSNWAVWRSEYKFLPMGNNYRR